MEKIQLGLLVSELENRLSDMKEQVNEVIQLMQEFNRNIAHVETRINIHKKALLDEETISG